MATPVIEEYIYEFSKAVGDAYYSIKRGIGTETLPNTALFELAQLRDLASLNLPRFGVLKTTPAGFEINSYPTDSRYIYVTEGQIAYNGSRLTVGSQVVPIARAFGSIYPSDYVYGVRVGFSLQEAQKATQLFTTTLTQTAYPTDTVIYIADVATAQRLGFPLKAYIDTEFVIFTGVNAEGTGLTLGTGIVGLKGSRSKVNFLYEPKISSICGLPVDTPYQSGQNPIEFSYYPPMPTDWLPIANLLVENPSSPKLVHSAAVLTPVRVATTSANDAVVGSFIGTTLTLAGVGTNIIDGVTLVAGDRVLFKDFPTGQKQYQGICTYVNNTTYIRSGDLCRSAEFVTGLGIGVTDGIINAGLEFAYLGPDNPTVNPATTALPFGPITIDSFAVEDKRVEWPTAPSYSPLFTPADAKAMVSTIDATRAALRQVRQTINVTDLILAFERYTNTLSSNPQTSFNMYWSALPFRPRTNFSIGVSYDNLVRMEFPSSFAEAFYDIRNIDTQHTFAIFRGDMYATGNLFNATLISPTATLTAAKVDNNTTLTRGVYSYGFTAINSQGESVATYKTAEIIDNNYYMIDIRGTNVSSANAYNIYRRSTLVGEQTEYLLNTYGGITGLQVPYDTSGISVDTNGIGITAGNVYGAKIIISNGTLLGGVGLKFKFNLSSGVSISNGNDYIDVALYSANGNNAGSKISDGTPIYYKYITNTFEEHVSRFSPVNVEIGNSYFIVLNMSRGPVATGIGSTTLYISVSTSLGSTNPVTRYDDTASFPTLGHIFMSNSTYIKTYGLLDNGIQGTLVSGRGIKLTGNKSITPRYASIYVPTIVPPSSTDSISISLGLSATNTGTQITKNGLNVTVIGRNGASGTPVSMTGYVPKGTTANTRIALTPATLIDRIDSVYVTPSSTLSELTVNTYGQIIWSLYDFFTIETTPA